MENVSAIRAWLTPGRSVVLASGAATLALVCGSVAQELSDAPTGNPYEQPSLTRPEATPFIFAPDIFSVPTPTEISQSINTPSGLSPFTGTRSIARGLQLTASQAVRFDDNARRLASGAFAPVGRSKSDLYSVTNFGASYAREFGLQTVFVRGDFGLTRYRSNADLNNTRYQGAAGVNWQIGSPCQGSLTFSASQSEVEFQDIVVGAATSLSKSERVDFLGRCRIFSNVFATFGAGLAKSSVSAATANDSLRKSVRVGLEYAVPQLHTIGFETIYTTTDFLNRISTSLNPTTTLLEQREYRGYYIYVVSPKTTINLSGGVVQSTSSSPFGSSTQNLPLMSASVNWRATPKLMFSLGGQVVTSPPQSIVADFQRSQSMSLSVLYNYSQKLNVSAVYVHSRQTQSVLSPVTGVASDRESRSNTLSIDTNYQASPFLYAGLGYRFSERTDKLSGVKVTSNLYTMSLNYRR